MESPDATGPTHLTSAGLRVVVAGAVERDGRLLAARRTRPASVAGGWELPGGKVEPGEAAASALVRELREELAIDTVVVGSVPGPVGGDWPLDDGSVLRVLRARILDGTPVPGVAHDEVLWLGPRELDDVAWLAPDLGPVVAAGRRLDTWVDFPSRAVDGEGVVTRVEPLADGRTAVVLDRTPFHPLDHGWPDQPGDTGTIDGAAVVDCLTGALDDAGTLAVGEDIAVRRGDPSVSWVVVHVVDGAAPALGSQVAVRVDVAGREALSRGHSACHLASMALNETSVRFWSKEPPKRDTRGFPFLDQTAITVSRIHPDGAYDAYRCGKSLRKAGFDSAGFLAELDAVAAEADHLLDRWVTRGAVSRIETDGDPTLAARRRWWCDVEGGPAVIPCGGTHVADLAALGRVRVAYAATEDGFEVRTSVG